MADDPTAAGDEEPTRVTPATNGAGNGGRLADAVPEVPPTVTPAGSVIDAPAGDAAPSSPADGPSGAPAAATNAPTDTPPAAAAGSAAPKGDATTGEGGGAQPPKGPGPADGAKADPGAGDKDSARARGRAAAGRTAEGAKVVGDRVSQAASATAQALRDTDVREIAEHTTNLIENARPFFLAAFAIVFSFLASVENHAAIGVVFAIGAILCVLGAAYAAELTKVIGPRGNRDRQSRK